jgi:hypothetical protein
MTLSFHATEVQGGSHSWKDKKLSTFVTGTGLKELGSWLMHSPQGKFETSRDRAHRLQFRAGQGKHGCLLRHRWPLYHSAPVPSAPSTSGQNPHKRPITRPKHHRQRRPSTCPRLPATLFCKTYQHPRRLSNHLLKARAHAPSARPLSLLILDSATTFHSQDRFGSKIARHETPPSTIDDVT